MQDPEDVCQAIQDALLGQICQDVHHLVPINSEVSRTCLWLIFQHERAGGGLGLICLVLIQASGVRGINKVYVHGITPGPASESIYAPYLCPAGARRATNARCM